MKVMKKAKTFKIAAVYIGTVVGAGFASGQEILQFFNVYGIGGLFGVILATIFFVLFGYIIMELGFKLNSRSHSEIIRYTSGRYIGGIIDMIISFFLFGALTAMIAGSGALFNQQFGISSIWGNIIMVLLTTITVLTGLKGVTNSISAIVPFLLISVIGVGIGSMFLVPPDVNNITIAASGKLSMDNWLWSAVLYVSYNIILASAILGPLGSNAENKKVIRNGAIAGGVGLGTGAGIIYFAMSGNTQKLINFEIPMLYIAGRISLVVQIIYGVVLIAEVYSTAVGSMFGFVARVTDKESHKTPYIIIVCAILAFMASRFGFSNIVKYVYPAVGYGGLIFLASLIYYKYKNYWKGYE